MKPGKPAKRSAMATVPAGHQRGDVMPAERLRTVLAICEAVAEGGKLTKLLGKDRPEGWPSYATWGEWVAQFPAVREAYRAARELSAQTLEDKALGIVDSLLEPGAEYTGTYVQAAGKAMEQLRWSAERRDPGSFGSKAEAQTIVPIQINTTLDLGQGGVLGLPPPDVQKTYGYVVEVEATEPETETETEPPEPEAQPEPEVPPNRFGITELPQSAIKRNPGGRPKKGHKSPTKTAEAATRVAKNLAAGRPGVAARARPTGQPTASGRPGGKDGTGGAS